MQIIVVNVNTSETMTEVIGKAARRHASAGTEIIALRPHFGAEAVDCNFESYLSAVAALLYIRKEALPTLCWRSMASSLWPGAQDSRFWCRHLGLGYPWSSLIWSTLSSIIAS